MAIFFSSDRSSYSDSVLLLVRANFFRFLSISANFSIVSSISANNILGSSGEHLLFLLFTVFFLFLWCSGALLGPVVVTNIDINFRIVQSCSLTFSVLNET